MNITSTNMISQPHHTTAQYESPSKLEGASPEPTDSVTFGGESWVERPGSKAFGGAILGAVPGVGGITNLYYGMGHLHPYGPVTQKNVPLGLALGVLTVGGAISNAVVFTGELGPLGIATALGISSATSALGAYLAAVE